MTEDNRRTAIEQEIRHSEAALEAARALRDLSLYNDALSRLYYALLLTEGIEPNRHRAIAKLLSSRFAASGTLMAEDIAVVSRAQTYRDLADYDRSWEATRPIMDTAFADVEPLLARVREILERGGWIPPAAR